MKKVTATSKVIHNKEMKTIKKGIQRKQNETSEDNVNKEKNIDNSVNSDESRQISLNFDAENINNNNYNNYNYNYNCNECETKQQKDNKKQLKKKENKNVNKYHALSINCQSNYNKNDSIMKVKAIIKELNLKGCSLTNENIIQLLDAQLNKQKNVINQCCKQICNLIEYAINHTNTNTNMNQKQV